MVVFFTGSYPPDKCGVGDYLKKLVEAIESVTSRDVVVIRSIWELLNLFLFKKEKILHFNVQYPTVGYVGGLNSLKPHLAIIIAWIFRVDSSVTLHEYSSLSAKAKFVSKAFRLARVVIFTTEYERSAATCFYSSKVIPIASNIPAAETALFNSSFRKYDYIHFGMLAPGKGVDEYIDLICEIRKVKKMCSAALVGYIPELFNSYGEILALRAEENCIDLFVDKAEADVSNLLASSKIALFPYPDGVSERRGTALAAMLNGCIVITLSGKFSLPLSPVCLIKDDVSEMLECAISTLDNVSAYRQLATRSYEYSLKRNWTYLAKQYEGVFNEKNYSK